MANLLDWLKKETQDAWGGLGNEINRAIGGVGNQAQGFTNNIRNVIASQPRNIQQAQQTIGRAVPQIKLPPPDILGDTLRNIQNITQNNVVKPVNDKSLELGIKYLNSMGISQEEARNENALDLIASRAPTIVARSGPAMQALRALGVQLPSANDALKTTGDITQGLVGDNPVTGWVGENMVQPLLKGVTNQVDVASGQKQYTPGIKGYAEIGNDAFNTASLAWSPAKAGVLAKGGKPALQAIPGSLGRGALAGGGSNALYQASEKGVENIDPLEVLMSAGAGGLLNTAIPLASGKAGRIAKEAVGMEKARIAAGEMPGGFIAGPGAADWKNAKGKFFGPEGAPKVELPDNKAKLTIDTTSKATLETGNTVPLNKVFDHADMYKQYPELAQVQVKLDPTLPSDVSGVMAKDGSSISLNPTKMSDQETLKNTLLHEAQHWVQTKEGFARGTSPNELINIPENKTAELVGLQEKLDNAINNGASDQQIRTVQKQLNDSINAQKVAMDKSAETASNRYLRSSGEMEARNVEIRQNMTPEQRANTPFYDTMDVPESEVFVQQKGSSARLRPVKEGVVDTAYKDTVKNGGVTISLEGNKPSKGLAYAPYKGTEQIVDKGKFTPDDVGNYVNKHLKELNEEGNHIGLWEEDGKIFLDISKVGDVSPATVQRAIDGEQLAVFDLGTFDEVPLGKINKGVYNPLYEATNHPYLNKGQNTSSNTQGISGKSGQVPEVPTQAKSSTQGSYRVEIPKGKANTPDVPLKSGKTRGFTKNIFKNNFYEGNPTAKAVVEAMPKYKELPNRVTMGKAATEINKDPSGALASIITKPQLTSATDVAKGNLLLRQAVESGDVQTAIELGTKLGVDGTKLGQAVQAFATWKKTTPEGIVQYATKKAGLVDEQLDPKLAGELIAMAKRIEKMPESLEKAKLKNSLLAKADNIAKTWKDKLTSVLATPRAAMATADLSAPLRQGGVLGTRFPKQASQAAVEQIKYMGSTKAYEKAMYEITQRPSYSKMKMSKLAVSAAEGLTGTEEQFMSNILEGKAFKKIGIGHVVAGSDRAYTGFLTKLRADVFDKIVNDSEKAGIKLGRKELESIAKFVNTASGRGSGKTIDKHAGLLSSVLFSPRLWKSRLDLLNPVYYAKLSPVARKYALQSSASFASVAGTVLGLAALGGATVVLDPRNADFAKIKVGNTRYDILGGLQQNIRLGAQLITGEKINSETGELQTLGPERGFGKPSRVDLLYQFFENKENPLLAYATKILRGTDQAGNPINPLTEGVKIATPLVAQGMYETAKDTGSVAQGIGMNIPALFGVGAQTYGQIATKDQGKSAKELIKEENGKVSTVIDGKTESFENRQKAEKAIDKSEFEKSGENSKVIGDTYYYKSKDGEIRTKTKVNYEFDKTDSKVSLEMDRAKARNDLDSWLDYADKKYQAMENKKQSYSPDTEQDKIDDLTLKQENLLETAQKYVGYGGFTKGKSSKSGSSRTARGGGSGGSGAFITTGFKTAAQLKAPKISGIKVKSPTYKGSAKKLSVKKLPKIKSA